MTISEPTLFDPPTALARSQQEVLEALRVIAGPGDTSDIQRALREHGVPREKNCIAKRLTELEGMGLVERVGRNFDRPRHPTTWRRK